MLLVYTTQWIQCNHMVWSCNHT